MNDFFRRKKTKYGYFLLCMIVFGCVYCIGKSSDTGSSEDTFAHMDVSQNGVDESVSENSTLSENSAEDVGDVSVSENTIEELPLLTQTSQVKLSYFDDACFIGDSRTVGLMMYSDFKNADFFCSSGLTIYDVFKEPSGKFKDGNWTENIGEALKKKDYGKIYIMIGINEMGTGDANGDYFMRHYEEALSGIRELQPKAKIYLQGIMKVTKEYSDSHASINNPNIEARNQRIAELADNRSVFYLDMNEVVVDENGALDASISFDGVHLYARAYDRWQNYLLTHAYVDLNVEQSMVSENGMP